MHGAPRRPPGPFEGLAKEDLPGAAVRVHLRRAAGRGAPRARAGTTWCTRTTGCPARSAGSPRSAGTCRSCTAMHTMAKVKNAHARRRRRPEPEGAGHRRGAGRRRGRPADREHRRRGRPARRPVRRRPGHGAVVQPGVDLDVFRPGDRLRAARARLGVRAGRRPCCCSSAGSSRSRPRTCCCAPSPRWSPRDPSLRDTAAGRRRRRPERHPGWRDPHALERPGGRARHRRRRALRAAGRRARGSPTGTARPTSCVVPSLQRVVRAGGRWRRRRAARPWSPPAVGGLPTAVADGVSGLLVDGHDPRRWADALDRLLADRDRARPRWSRGRGAARRAVRLGRHGRGDPRRLPRGPRGPTALRTAPARG